MGYRYLFADRRRSTAGLTGLIKHLLFSPRPQWIYHIKAPLHFPVAIPLWPPYGIDDRLFHLPYLSTPSQ